MSSATQNMVQRISAACGMPALLLAIVALMVGWNNGGPTTVEYRYNGLKSGTTSVTVEDESLKEEFPGIKRTMGVPGDQYEGEFVCAAGKPVTATVGRSTSTVNSVKGLTLSVRGTWEGRETYHDQLSVLVDIKTGTSQLVPAMIINTGAHVKAPDFYPQAVIPFQLRPDGTSHLEISTAGYVENYESDGITSVTVCVQ